MKISDVSLDSDMFEKSGMNIQILTLVMQVRGGGGKINCPGQLPPPSKQAKSDLNYDYN